MLFVPTPKVACTSLMWALVDLEDARTGRVSESAMFEAEATVHDRAVHSLRSLGDLSVSERAEVLSDAGWARFAVTRNPYERVLSAWADKVLLGHVDYLGSPLDHLFSSGPSAWSDGVDLGALFRSFVHQLPSNRVQFADVHLAPQVDVLAVDRVPYSHLAEFGSKGG